MRLSLTFIAVIACVMSFAPAARAQKRFVLSPEVSAFVAYPINLAFSPNSQQLAILHTIESDKDPAAPRAKESRISIRDVASREQIRLLDGQLPGGGAGALQIAFSPDGSFLALAEKSASVRLWNTTNWEATAVSLPLATDREPKSRYPVAPSECVGVAFSPDSKRLAVLCDLHSKSPDGLVWIHDIQSGKSRITLDLDGRPSSIAWQSDSRLALVVNHIGSIRNQHCELQEWDLLSTPSAGSPPALTRRHKLGDSIHLARFSSNGRTLAFSVNRNLSICNVRDGQFSHLGTFGDWNGSRTSNYRTGVCALALAPDGATLVAGGNANQTHTRLKFFALRSQIFDFDSDAFEHGPGYGVVNIAFAPDGGHMATIVHRWAGSGEPLFLWDLGSKAN